MLTLDALAAAALVADARGAPLLAELDFSTGTQYLCSWGDDIPVDGHVYKGLGGLAAIQGLSESDDLATRSLSLSLSLVSAGQLAAAMAPAATYRRRRARIYLQLIGANYQPLGAKVLRWQGYMDMISIERTPPKTTTDDRGAGKIILKCSRAGMPMSRRSVGLRSTHEQQISRHPGDNGLEYQQSLIETPTVWLTIAFQKQ